MAEVGDRCLIVFYMSGETYAYSLPGHSDAIWYINQLTSELKRNKELIFLKTIEANYKYQYKVRDKIKKKNREFSVSIEDVDNVTYYINEYIDSNHAKRHIAGNNNDDALDEVRDKYCAYPYIGLFESPEDKTVTLTIKAKSFEYRYCDILECDRQEALTRLFGTEVSETGWGNRVKRIVGRIFEVILIIVVLLLTIRKEILRIKIDNLPFIMTAEDIDELNYKDDLKYCKSYLPREIEKMPGAQYRLDAAGVTTDDACECIANGLKGTSAHFSNKNMSASDEDKLSEVAGDCGRKLLGEYYYRY